MTTHDVAGNTVHIPPGPSPQEIALAELVAESPLILGPSSDRGPALQNWYNRVTGEDRNRYFFDFQICTHSRGWQQYDTDQDAWYFGVWIHREWRWIVTYAEGDLNSRRFETEEDFQEAIRGLNAHHDAPPPAFRVIEPEGITLVYDEAALFGREMPQAEG